MAEQKTAQQFAQEQYKVVENAAGNAMRVWADLATTTTEYSFVDANAGGLAYYRLSQTDISDRRETFQTVAAGCEANSTEIVNAWDDGQVLNLMESSTEPGIYDLTMSDAQCKVMVTRGSVAINQGFTPLVIGKEGIASGAYMVTLQNANDLMVRRVFLH